MRLWSRGRWVLSQRSLFFPSVPAGSQGPDQLVKLNRLYEIVVETCLTPLFAISVLTIAGRGDDVDVREARQLPDGACHVVARQPRESNIEHYGVGLKCPCGLDGAVAIERKAD